MSSKQLFIFAYALTGLIDHELKEDHIKIAKKLNDGLIAQYLHEKYSSRMPLLSKANFCAVNRQILDACGGDASIYLRKYPVTENGLTMLLNLVLNAIWIEECNLLAEAEAYCHHTQFPANIEPSVSA